MSGGRLVVIKRSGGDGPVYQLPSGTVTIGQDLDCDIRVMLPAISQVHASISVRRNQTVIRHVANEGETLVNGSPVSLAALKHSDIITLGDRAIRWEYSNPAKVKARNSPVLKIKVTRGSKRGHVGRKWMSSGPPSKQLSPQLRAMLEMKHRASLPSSDSRARQVAIVQPQRREEENSSPLVSEVRTPVARQSNVFLPARISLRGVPTPGTPSRRSNRPNVPLNDEASPPLETPQARNETPKSEPKKRTPKAQNATDDKKKSPKSAQKKSPKSELKRSVRPAPKPTFRAVEWMESRKSRTASPLTTKDGNNVVHVATPRPKEPYVEETPTKLSARKAALDKSTPKISPVNTKIPKARNVSATPKTAKAVKSTPVQKTPARSLKTPVSKTPAASIRTPAVRATVSKETPSVAAKSSAKTPAAFRTPAGSSRIPAATRTPRYLTKTPKTPAAKKSPGLITRRSGRTPVVVQKFVASPELIKDNVEKIEEPLNIDVNKKAALLILTGRSPHKLKGTVMAKSSSAKVVTPLESPMKLNNRKSTGRKSATHKKSPRNIKLNPKLTPGKQSEELSNSYRSTRSNLSVDSEGTETPGKAKRSKANQRSSSSELRQIRKSEIALSMSPKKSALKSPLSGTPKKNESIRFDLSNLGIQESPSGADEESLRLRLSRTPSPRPPIHGYTDRSSSIMEKALNKSYTPERSPRKQTPTKSPASPRPSSRTSLIVQNATDAISPRVSRSSANVSQSSRVSKRGSASLESATRNLSFELDHSPSKRKSLDFDSAVEPLAKRRSSPKTDEFGHQSRVSIRNGAASGKESRKNNSSVKIASPSGILSPNKTRNASPNKIADETASPNKTASPRIVPASPNRKVSPKGNTKHDQSSRNQNSLQRSKSEDQTLIESRKTGNTFTRSKSFDQLSLSKKSPNQSQRSGNRSSSSTAAHQSVQSSRQSRSLSSSQSDLSASESISSSQSRKSNRNLKTNDESYSIIDLVSIDSVQNMSNSVYDSANSSAISKLGTPYKKLRGSKTLETSTPIVKGHTPARNKLLLAALSSARRMRGGSLKVSPLKAPVPRRSKSTSIRNANPSENSEIIENSQESFETVATGSLRKSAKASPADKSQAKSKRILSKKSRIDISESEQSDYSTFDESPSKNATKRSRTPNLSASDTDSQYLSQDPDILTPSAKRSKKSSSLTKRQSASKPSTPVSLHSSRSRSKSKIELNESGWSDISSYNGSPETATRNSNSGSRSATRKSRASVANSLSPRKSGIEVTASASPNLRQAVASPSPRYSRSGISSPTGTLQVASPNLRGSTNDSRGSSPRKSATGVGDIASPEKLSRSKVSIPSPAVSQKSTRSSASSPGSVSRNSKTSIASVAASPRKSVSASGSPVLSTRRPKSSLASISRPNSRSSKATDSASTVSRESRSSDIKYTGEYDSQNHSPISDGSYYDSPQSSFQKSKTVIEIEDSTYNMTPMKGRTPKNVSKSKSQIVTSFSSPDTYTKSRVSRNVSRTSLPLILNRNLTNSARRSKNMRDSSTSLHTMSTDIPKGKPARFSNKSPNKTPDITSTINKTLITPDQSSGDATSRNTPKAAGSGRKSTRKSVNAGGDGQTTPENMNNPNDATTPVLDIQHILETSTNAGKQNRKGSARKTIHGLPINTSTTKVQRKVNSDTKKKLTPKANINTYKKVVDKKLNRKSDNLDDSVESQPNVTPKSSVSFLIKDSVKERHSTARKSKSRKSIIDHLNESQSSMKSLFNSPVKRKLSQSITQYGHLDLELDDSRKSKRSVGNKSDSTFVDLDGFNTPQVPAELFVSPLLKTAQKSPRAGTSKSTPNVSEDISNQSSKSPKGVSSDKGSSKSRKSLNNVLAASAGKKSSNRKEPRNSLTNIAGIRKLFDDRPKKSPRNSLTNLFGVKKTFRSPLRPQKSPKNDLTNIPSVRSLYSPRRRNDPKNALDDISGVGDLFNISHASVNEVSKSEALFDQLTGRTPIKSYSRTKMPSQKHIEASANLLGVPVEFIQSRVDEWLNMEKEKNAANAATRNSPKENNMNKSNISKNQDNLKLNKSKESRKSLKENNSQVDVMSPRSRRTMTAEKTSYSIEVSKALSPKSNRKTLEKTLPFKKRNVSNNTSLKRKVPETTDEESILPIKKRALVPEQSLIHSTPLKNKLTKKDAKVGMITSMAPVSPISSLPSTPRKNRNLANTSITTASPKAKEAASAKTTNANISKDKLSVSAQNIEKKSPSKEAKSKSKRGTKSTKTAEEITVPKQKATRAKKAPAVAPTLTPKERKGRRAAAKAVETLTVKPKSGLTTDTSVPATKSANRNKPNISIGTSTVIKKRTSIVVSKKAPKPQPTANTSKVAVAAPKTVSKGRKNASSTQNAVSQKNEPKVSPKKSPVKGRSRATKVVPPSPKSSTPKRTRRGKVASQSLAKPTKTKQVPAADANETETPPKPKGRGRKTAKVMEKPISPEKPKSRRRNIDIADVPEKPVKGKSNAVAHMPKKVSATRKTAVIQDIPQSAPKRGNKAQASVKVVTPPKIAKRASKALKVVSPKKAKKSESPIQLSPKKGRRQRETIPEKAISPPARRSKAVAKASPKSGRKVEDPVVPGPAPKRGKKNIEEPATVLEPSTKRGKKMATTEVEVAVTKAGKTAKRNPISPKGKRGQKASPVKVSSPKAKGKAKSQGKTNAKHVSFALETEPETPPRRRKAAAPEPEAPPAKRGRPSASTKPQTSQQTKAQTTKQPQSKNARSTRRKN